MKTKYKKRLWNRLHEQIEVLVSNKANCKTARKFLHLSIRNFKSDMNCRDVVDAANFVEILLEEFFVDSKLTPPELD